MNRVQGLFFRILFLLAFTGLILACVCAYALIPPYVSDPELAQKPIIVVAHWEKGTFDIRPISPKTPQDNQLGPINIVRCKLVIERVIKGDITPGRHTLMLTGCATWRQDGHGLCSGSS